VKKEMKKFILLYIGSVNPDQEMKDGWSKWFGVLGNRVVDSGNPFGKGKEISKDDSKELDFSDEAIAGYTIVNAESLEEIEELVSNNCPMVTNVRIYEALAM